MPALITSLIDKVDNFEFIRDEIAAILKVESAGQEALADAAARDPREWALRVFVERTDPWNEFLDLPQDKSDATPIVNVWFDRDVFDPHASNAVEQQKGTVTYNIDCYGYGLARPDPDGGQIPGDREAALEAQRAIRLVRNVLMSSPYVLLGHQGVVWRRWPNTIQTFQAPIDQSTAQKVAAARLQLDVDISEFAPQESGQSLTTIHATVIRKETGEVYLEAEYQ